MKARNFQHFHQQPKHAQQPRMLSKYQNRFGSYIVAGQVYNLCTKGTDRPISGPKNAKKKFQKNPPKISENLAEINI